MQKTKKQSFNNVYFLNDQAQHHYLDTLAASKLNEIEISTSEDFTQQFEEWVQNRTTNELLLIWAVLNEIQADAEQLDLLIQKQCDDYKIPEWLALSGTLAFFSVHYLNKFLIEEELKNRGTDFDCYLTSYEMALVTNSQALTFRRNFLKDLKENIYADQLNKAYFTELADTITAMTIH